MSGYGVNDRESSTKGDVGFSLYRCVQTGCVDLQVQQMCTGVYFLRT
jgi:hypothetical protein